MKKTSWIKKEILLPSDYSADDAQTVAEEILNYIIERTKDGKGVDNTPWVGKAGEYEDSYKNSLEFKIARKTDKVNLSLSGEMLDSLEILQAKKGKIVIGYQRGSEMNGRAEGNILGTYGSDVPNPSKARNFMELSNNELSKILKGLDVLPRNVQNEIAKMAREGAIEIVDKFKFSVKTGNEGEEEQ
jgi:hypothetical protein